MDKIGRWLSAVAFLLALVAFMLALLPLMAHAAQPADDFFCDLVADAAQVAAQARDQGMLLGQYKSMIAQRATRDNAGLTALLNKVGTVIYTSEDFADLTPEQAVRYAYRSCMTAETK